MNSYDGFKDGNDDFANNLGFNERQGNSDVQQLTDLPQILRAPLKTSIEKSTKTWYNRRMKVRMKSFFDGNYSVLPNFHKVENKIPL